MKRLLIAATILLSSTMAFASGADLWISSNTATADTNKVLCPKYPTAKQSHGALGSVCINFTTPGTYSVYNASGSAINPIATIDTSVRGCLRYDISFSSGLTYVNSSTANVTAMYNCF